jgi:serine/threonine protein kinase/Tfp pilus assembly protein PilF
MGEVYLADDTKLGRRVAIKLLPSSYTQDATRVRRLVREAQSASALNHPNIITIHEVAETNGTHYIATEFIDGATLRERMSQGLELRVILDIAIQLATGLAAAHEAGIVHRDIKPENAMVRRDGIVKILDFGLVKLADASSDLTGDAPTATQGTQDGTIVGTAHYMSPEQARGSDVDSRTDIFSLGVVLYELVARKPPFTGNNSIEVLGAILNREPEPLEQVAPDVPVELQRIIYKALRKDREERYQTVKELLTDLKELNRTQEFQAQLGRSTPARTSAGNPLRRWALVVGLLVALAFGVVLGIRFLPGEAIESLAVLPFANGGANADTQYLSDGMTDSLINNLSRLPNLKVMSRSAVFQYKAKPADARTAGKELGVRAVLTGTLTERGDDLTISAELVDARDNSHLWGEQYNRKRSDMQSVQAELSRDISEKLRLRISGEEKQQLMKKDTVSAEAYDVYLKGLHADFTAPAGNRERLRYFQRAIEIDPRYGRAYAALGQTYASSAAVGTTTDLSPKEAMAKAKEAVLTALELDDGLAEAHSSLASISSRFDWNWETAEREFKRALELNPNDVNTHHLYSHFLISMGRFDESLAESMRALSLDPLSVNYNFHLGYHYWASRQLDQAIAQLQKTLEMNPNHPGSHGVLGLTYVQKGRYSEAITEVQREMDLGGFDLRDKIGYIYAKMGKPEEARKLLAELLKQAESKPVSAYGVARIYAGLKDQDQTFAWLDKAAANHDSNLTDNPGIRVDQMFDDFRRDPRFAALLQRMRLPSQ